MSIVYSNSASKSGIVERIRRITSTDSASYPVADITSDVNMALDVFFSIAIQASGVWQLDDSNQTDYPIISTNLVSGQRDYAFTTDGSGNLILDIYRVMVAGQNSIFYDLELVDQHKKDFRSLGMVDGQNIEGVPSKYNKLANGIFLDAIPNYNSTGGLKVFINRESTYFTTADTTKKPGVPGILHEYFVVKPSYVYAYSNGLPNLGSLEKEVIKYEGDERLGIPGMIGEYFSKRSKDEKQQIKTIYRSSR